MCNLLLNVAYIHFSLEYCFFQGLDFRAKVNHKNNNKELRTDVIIEYLPKRKAGFNLSLKKENTANHLKMSGDIKLSIPRREMRLASSIEEKMPNVFNHEVTVQWAKGLQASVITQYKKTPGISLHSIQSDIDVVRMEPISLSFSTQLIPKDFSMYVKIVRTSRTSGPNTVIEIDSSYNLQSNKMEGQLNFTSILDGREYLNFGINMSTYRNRESSEMKSILETSIDHQISKLILTHQKTGNGFISAIAFTSPYEMMQSFNFKTNTAITSRYVTSRNELSLNNKNKVEMSIMGKNEGYDNKKKLMGSISIKTSIPEYQILHIAAKHEKDQHTFSSKMEGKLNETPFGVIVNMVNKEGVSEGKLELITFDGTPKSITWQNRMTISNVHIHTEAKWAKDKIGMEAKFSTQNSTMRKIHFVIKTPFNNVRKINAEFECIGSLPSFTTKTKIDLIGHHNITNENTFAFNGEDLNMHVHFTSPFENFEHLKLAASHKGDLSQFSNRLEVEYTRSKKVILESAFSKLDDISAVAKLQTPWKAANGHAEFNLAGELHNRFTSHSLLKYGEKKIQINTDMAINPEIVGKIKLVSTFEGMKDLNLKLNYTGSLNNFNSEISVQYATNKKVIIAGSFKDTGNIHAKVSLKTPLVNYEDLQVSFNLEGIPKNFKCTGKVRWSPRHIILGNIDFSKGAAITGNVSLSTPYTAYENMSAVFNHSGNYNKFRSSIEINFQSNKWITGLIQMNRTSGRFNLNTPYFKALAASINHQGNLRNFQSNAKATYGDQKVIALVELNTEQKIMGKLSIKSPFYQFENITIDVMHQGSSKMFRSEASFQYSPINKIEASANFAYNPRNISGKFDFKTPFRNFKKNIMTFHIIGSMENINASSSIDNTLSGKHRIDVEYKAPEGIPSQGSIKYNCPSYAEKKISFTNARKGGKYVSSAFYNWEPSKQVSINSQLRYGGDWYTMTANGVVKITTPYPYARNIRLAISHHHDNMRYLNQSIQFERNNIRTLDTDFVFRNDDKTSFNAKMRAPYPMAALFDIPKTYSEYSGYGKLNWNTQNKNSEIEIHIDHKNENNGDHTNRSMIMRIMTPFRAMVLHTKINRSRYSLQHKTEFSWDMARNKKVSYDVNFINRSHSSNTDYNLLFKIDTPIRDIELNLFHKGDSKEFNSTADIKWDAGRNASRKLNMKLTYQINGYQHLYLVTIKHPKMQKVSKFTFLVL